MFGDSPSSLVTQIPNNKLGGDEETYLVVGVDDLSQPIAILESAWLITIKSASSQIVLVPLYPDKSPPHEPKLVSTNDFDVFKDIKVIQKHEVDAISHKITGIDIDIELPADFPEKYKQAVVSAANQCSVKRLIANPPRIDVNTI